MTAGKCLAGLVALAGACAPRETGTSLLVSVESDFRHPAIDAVKVALTVGGDQEHVFAVAGDTVFPLQAGIIPRGKPDFEVEVTATALLGATAIVSQAAIVGFDAGASKEITLRLVRECAKPPSCREEETCAAGTCIDKRAVGSPTGQDAGVDAPGESDGPADGRLADRPGPPGRWEPPMRQIPPGLNFNGLWISGGTAWVVGGAMGRGVAVRIDDVGFGETTLPAGTPTLNAVWGSGPEDIWAVGFGGTIVRRTGGVWATSPVVAPTLTGLWGSSPGSVWAVGSGGTVLRWNGTAWLPAATGIENTFDLLSVTGISVDEVWAVGTRGGVFRLFEAKPAERQNHLLTANTLFDVWAQSRSNVWAVGNRAALRFDGARWTSVPGTPELSHGIWGSAANDVWVVGSTGGLQAIAYFDGTFWQPAATPSVPPLQSVRGVSATEVVAVGNLGTLLRLRR